MSRRLLAAMVLLGVVSVLGLSLAWLGRSVGADRMPALGSRMPDAAYRVAGGSDRALAAETGALVVMIARESCSHCRAQVKAMLADWPAFRVNRLLVLSYEQLPSVPAADWDRLGHLPGVQLGWMDAKAVAARFGTLATPAFFLYDSKHLLRHEVVGEIDAQRMAALMDATEQAR